MADAVGEAERVNLVAAIEHRVGQAGAAKEHSDLRPPFDAAAERNQLALDQVRTEVGLGELEQLFERHDRIALHSQVERDEIGFAARQNGNRRAGSAEVAAIVDFRERRLDCAVATVDDQHLGPDPGNRAQRFADLVRALHLVMEKVGMVRAKAAHARQLRDIPRRLGIRQEGNPRPVHQPALSTAHRPPAACGRFDVGRKCVFGMILSVGPL